MSAIMIPPAERVSLGPRAATFTRMAIAIAAGANFGEAKRFAKQRWGEDAPAVKALDAVVKAAIAGGSATGSTWGQQLVGAGRQAAMEFFQLVASMSIIGRMASLRRVPFHVRATVLSSGASAGWRGEGAARKVSALSFDSLTLAPLEISATLCLTKELLRDGSAEAEDVVRLDLVRAAVAALDTGFIDPDSGALPDIRPASITNGLSPTAATVATLRADLAGVISDFAGDLMTSAFVCHPSLALRLPADQFPQAAIRNGNISGIPLLCSSSVPPISTAHDMLALIDGAGIAVAQDNAFGIQIADSATLQMDDEPTVSSVTPQPVNLVSMFQSGAVAVALDHNVNFQTARSGSVAVLSVAA